jgi:hypothetical protein
MGEHDPIKIDVYCKINRLRNPHSMEPTLNNPTGKDSAKLKLTALIAEQLFADTP